ncbi:glycosyl transferase [Acidothermaceae bacterium B102]|nr:glycosyl transferase [Acidothermaceae bacterium B102]
MSVTGTTTGSPGPTLLRRRPSLPRPTAAWAPPLVYLLLAIGICIHLLADPMHRVVAGNPHDVALISYFLQAEPSALLHGHNPLLITTMNAPDGVNVMWNTGLLLPAMILAPITLTLGGTVTFNLLLVAGLAGSAWTAYLLARRFTQHRVSAFLAGLLYGFSPAITHQAVGHLHLVVAFLLPPLLGTLVDVVRGPFRWWTSVLLGLLAAAQLLTGEELFACAAITGAVLCLVLAASRPRTAIVSGFSWLRGFVVAGATFGLLTFVPLLFQLHGPRQQFGSPFAFDYYKADLTWFVRPDRWMPLHRLASGLSESQLAVGNTEHDALLGWPLLLFGLGFVVWRWHDLKVRAVGGTAVVLGIFSLGSMLKADNTWTHLHLPWFYVQQLPLMKGLLPERFGILVAGLVGLLIAFGADLLLERVPSRPVARLTLLVAALILLAPLTPRPLEATARPATPTFISTGLSKTFLASGSTVLVLPFPSPTNTNAMDWQADDGLRWSMPGGYFVGPGCQGRDCRGRAIMAPNLRVTSTLFKHVLTGALSPHDITPSDITQAAIDLRHWGVTEVMVGPVAGQATLAKAMTVLLGRPGIKLDDVWLWHLPS